MNKKCLSLLIGSALLFGVVQASDNPSFANELNDTHRQIQQRITELRKYAEDKNNVIVKEGKRFIEVNGVEYQINQDNYIKFDLPIPFTDESLFRNVFDFLNDDWELSWYNFGMVVVNKIYGNYDYGNGCLIEYGPEGDVYSPNGMTHLLLENDTCALEDGESLTKIKFLGTGKTLTYADFGYQAENEFLPESVALSHDKIYVGNTNSAFSHIARYDLRDNRLLAPITGFSLNGINETYRVVSDVMEHDGHLFVASLSSNRVDIYDTNNNDQIIMSLGTGSWSGNTFDKTLTHPYSVAANDEFIFVADITGKISIYRQEDVKLANHKKLSKYGFFNLPESNSIYRNLKMEVVNNELVVNFDNALTYVFDLASVKAGDELVEAKHRFTNTRYRNTYQASNGEVYVGSNVGVVKEFSKEQFSFVEGGIEGEAMHSFKGFFDTDTEKDQSLKSSFDLAVEAKVLAMLQDRTVVVANVDELRVHQDNKPATHEHVFDLLAPEVVKKPLLFDGESWESLTSNHEVRIDRLLSGTQRIDGLDITSYAAQTTYDLAVEARFGDEGKWLKLGTLDKLEPFATYTTSHTLKDGVKYASLDGMQSFKIKGLAEATYLPRDLVDIRLTSGTDKFVQKLTDWQSKWRLSFGTYSQANGHWEKITSAYAREWMIIMANYAYVMNSPEFEHLWFNYKQSIGQGQNEFFGNSGPVDGPGGNFTAEDYQNIYQAFMNRDRIRLGISTIGGGLGGGDVLGIDTWNYYAHYYNSGIGIVGHEFGHHWGSHDSSFANSSRGLQLMTHDIHQMMIRQQVLPYLDDEINAFYKTPREEMYNGVAEYLRVPRPQSNINLVERYFAENPMWQAYHH
ncbi:YncE family protein [Vibrio sagamiensis]|uniref:Uncharacterized protein n=1 Tax=Vibrio sagamiensis NBRC 104589 TaxID=1219064 RepID=A0A511QIT8_9VIBR|nr:hypothetical protein [Vibrio sagamiensis]PNQ69877.1 hypothetical protein C1141_05500 [Vibrio agarivorans]GEM77240.1 hypothetical protein VSA01S_33520 [Vibrio sagamiensis NBRC 104589]